MKLFCEHLLENVANVTGGRLVSGAVYLASTYRNDPALPFSVCAPHANVVFCGFGEKFSVDFSLPFRKQLSVYCVTHRSDNLEAAINLIVSGAVDFSAFEFLTQKSDRIEAILKDHPVGATQNLKQINTVTLI